MSNTYSIACKDCKKHLWIAQGWSIDDGHIYFEDKEVMKKLYKFFFLHKGHNLIFDNNCDLEDYEEIE